MDKRVYKPHAFALAAQLVMGNAIVTLPFYKSENAFAMFLLSAVITAIFAVAAAFVIKRSAKNKAAFCITAAISGALSLYGAGVAAYDYLRFLKDIQLPQTNAVLTAIALIAVVIIFVSSSNSAIYKFCLLAGVISAAAVIIALIGGITTFDTASLKISLDFSGTDLADAFKIFLRCFSSVAVAVTFIYFTKKETSGGVLLWGTAAGLAATAMSLAQSVLTLGLSSNTEYPYIKAVSVISSGSLFTRLDGLGYWIFFAAILIKVVVCTKTVTILIRKTIRINKTNY